MNHNRPLPIEISPSIRSIVKNKKNSTDLIDVQIRLLVSSREDWNIYNKLLGEYLYEGYETPVEMMDRLIDEINNYPSKMKSQQQR